jgi:hypothetical protein
MVMSDQLHALAALPPRNESPVHIGYDVVCPQSRTADCGEDKNLASVRNGNPTVQPVAPPLE